MKIKKITIPTLAWIIPFLAIGDVADFSSYQNENASRTNVADVLYADDLVMTMGRSDFLEIINDQHLSFPGQTAWSIPANSSGSQFAFIGKNDGGLFSITSISVAERSSPIISLSFRITGFRNGEVSSQKIYATDGIEGTEEISIGGLENAEYFTLEVFSRSLLLTSIEFTSLALETALSESLNFHYIYSDGLSVDLELDRLVLGREYRVEQSLDLSKWDPIRQFVALRPSTIPFVSLNDYDDRYFLRLGWNQP